MIPAGGDDRRLQALEFMPIYRGDVCATHSETTRILPQGDTIAARVVPARRGAAEGKRVYADAAEFARV